MMSLRRFLSTNRNAKTALALEKHTDGADSPNDRMRTRNVSVPVLSGRDSVDETESSLTNTLGVAETSGVAT